MIKKILILIMVLALVFAIMPSAIGAENKIKNGDFEKLNDKGNPEGWGYSGGSYGSEFKLDADCHGGSRAMKLSGDGNYYIYQSVNVYEGAEYEIKLWLKLVEKRGTGAMVKAEFMNGENQALNTPVEKVLSGSSAWAEESIKFTAPAGAKKMTLLLRLLGGGTVLYDDVELNEDLSKIQVADDGKVLIESVKNGGFEALGNTGAPANWGFAGGSYGSDITLSKDAHKGEKALKLSSSGSVYATQSINVTAGETYYLSLWFKKSKECSTMIKIEFADSEKQYLTPMEKALTGNIGEWILYEQEVAVPDTAKTASVLLRLLGGGEVFYDDFSLKSKSSNTAEVVKEEPPKEEEKVEKNEPLPGAKNVIINGGFEEKNGNDVPGWSGWKGSWGDYSYVTDEAAHSGKNSLKIQTAENNLPFAMQKIENVMPVAQYRLTAWVNFKMAEDAKEGKGVFKFEFYSENEIAGKYGVGSSFNSSFFYDTNGEWVKFEQYFTTPDNCKMVAIYPRLYSNGYFYMDDIECCQTLETPKYTLETDNYVYYTDWDKGCATVTLSSVYPEYTDSTVSFKLYDGNVVIDNKAGVAFINQIAKYEFDVDMLAEKSKKYNISATLVDKNGNDVETKTTFLYRYDRPTSMNKNGDIIVDGKVFDPILAYHLPVADFERAAKAGINLAQYYGGLKEGYQASFDRAAECGIKLLVPLYFNMKPAGDPSNMATTIDIVTKYKDHPAILGWMIMDEAYYHDPYPEEVLMASYKTIRDIDPDNVVFTMENSPDFYRKVGRFADVLGIDPYPSSTGKELTIVADCVKAAYEGVDYKKPVYALLQAFEWNGYFPSDDDMRHMIYDAYLEGAKSVGYYCFEESKEGKDLDETEIWDALVSFYNNESTDAFKAFSNGEYPIFNEGKSDTVWYKSYVKDGSLYMAVLNESKENISARIPVKSFDGEIVINGFKAEALFGGEGTYTCGETLDITLRKGQTVLFKITPDAAVDFSSLAKSEYIDLLDYPWARNQITVLRSKDIVNDVTPLSFAPGKKVTRAELAMFLVRTLGLSSDSTENFDDVDKNAYYAKEIAIGKATGILNGIGNNKYNPEAEISRQDLMTIIARGMNLTGDFDISSFSDNSLISDYALTHIKAMIASGLIKGNADGTLNPLGNATRAEAAVIMYRILQRK